MRMTENSMILFRKLNILNMKSIFNTMINTKKKFILLTENLVLAVIVKDFFEYFLFNIYFHLIKFCNNNQCRFWASIFQELHQDNESSICKDQRIAYLVNNQKLF